MEIHHPYIVRIDNEMCRLSRRFIRYFNVVTKGYRNSHIQINFSLFMEGSYLIWGQWKRFSVLININII